MAFGRNVLVQIQQLQFKHHDGKNDRHHPITECFYMVGSYFHKAVNIRPGIRYVTTRLIPKKLQVLSPLLERYTIAKVKMGSFDRIWELYKI